MFALLVTGATAKWYLNTYAIILDLIFSLLNSCVYTCFDLFGVVHTLHFELWWSERCQNGTNFVDSLVKRIYDGHTMSKLVGGWVDG